MIYTSTDKVYIWLDMFDFLSTKKYQILNSTEVDNLFSDFVANKSKYTTILTEQQYAKMLYAIKTPCFLDNYIEKNNKQNVILIALSSKYYPKELYHIDHAPIVLYCKGNIELLNSKCISVVGSRQHSIYGKKVTEKFVKTLCTNGFTIVSGLADGIDAISHKTALDNNQNTIAVLGGGFNHFYPQSNIALYHEIIKKGLVVSEYKIDELPAKYKFIARDRIITGLSCGLLITEASEKSGALHTKNFAIEYGKDLFVTPGNLDSIYSKGSNQIIRDFPTSFVTSPNQILEFYNIAYKPIKTQQYQLSFNEQNVLDALKNGEKHIDELVDITLLDIKTLSSLLTTLTVRGIIEKLAGNYYCQK